MYYEFGSFPTAALAPMQPQEPCCTTLIRCGVNTHNKEILKSAFYCAGSFELYDVSSNKPLTTCTGIDAAMALLNNS